MGERGQGLAVVSVWASYVCNEFSERRDVSVCEFLGMSEAFVKFCKVNLLNFRRFTKAWESLNGIERLKSEYVLRKLVQC